MCKKNVLIIDDETYVPHDPTNIPGDEYYHCLFKSEVPVEFTLKRKEKFPKKYLVWQAIDEMGNVSSPYIQLGTMDSKIYLEECLKKRLLPFIKKHHNLDEILFWSDMASIHYAADVCQWLKQQNINFVPLNNNAPNIPQARPIETFWALCKSEYKRQQYYPKDLDEFKKIWKLLSNKVAKNSAQTLMKGVRGKIRTIAYYGVDELLKKENK